MEHSIRIMVNRIGNILHDNSPSIMLFGSVVLDDFKLGWSDIDFVCLTEKAISDAQANELVHLRQTLMSEYAGNPYFRLFEGGMITERAFFNGDDDNVVYWGTSGQRRTNRYELDPFAKMELIDNGRLLLGNDFKHLLRYPSRDEIVAAIHKHYESIRQYGDSNVGWLFDIARCIYTLRTNRGIAKTKAGEWAVEEKICPDAEVMKRALDVRHNPLDKLNAEDTILWKRTLRTHIQAFADVLERELVKTDDGPEWI